MFKGSEPSLPDDFFPSFEDFDVYGNNNAEIAVVTYGRLFEQAAKALNILKEKNINIKIVKLNKIKPISPDAVSAVLDTSHIIFYEESEKSGGTGEIFNLMLSSMKYKGEFILRAIDDMYVHHATTEILLEEFGFDAQSMVRLISEVTVDE